VAKIPFVLTLGIIPTGDQLCDVLPISRAEVISCGPSLFRVSLESPSEKLGLLLVPVPLSRKLSGKY
jgi:hypothetical protein